MILPPFHPTLCRGPEVPFFSFQQKRMREAGGMDLFLLVGMRISKLCGNDEAGLAIVFQARSAICHFRFKERWRGNDSGK